MKKPLLSLLLISLGSSLLFSNEPTANAQSDAARGELAPPTLHALVRPQLATLPPPIRDPFTGLEIRPPEPEAVSPAKATSVSLPAFQIIGKQQDEAGWSVFISQPGKNGQVWVVKQGETFNKQFRVSKLAPPVLIISTLNGRQSKTFNIGKDEE